MALYLGGSQKLKVALNGVKCDFKVLTQAPIVEDIIRLFSSDNYILKDSNGLYLTVKESE